MAKSDNPYFDIARQVARLASDRNQVYVGPGYPVTGTDLHGPIVRVSTRSGQALIWTGLTPYYFGLPTEIRRFAEALLSEFTAVTAWPDHSTWLDLANARLISHPALLELRDVYTADAPPEFAAVLYARRRQAA